MKAATNPADEDARASAPPASASGRALRAYEPPVLVMTRREWTAMMLEDPQADPFWPESWLGVIDPLAGRQPELGAEDDTPPPAGLLPEPAKPR